MIHVVDDDAGMRRSTALLIEAAGFAVMQHDVPDSMLSALNGEAGACVVADLRMPAMDGLEMLVRIRDFGCQIPVIIMTGYGDIATAVKAIKLGAWDFIEKPFAQDTLLKGIQSALNGHKSNQDPRVRTFLERIAQLSRREREVLDLILAGETSKEIARDLDISPRTVETYRIKIMSKTSCENVRELVGSAARAGVI